MGFFDGDIDFNPVNSWDTIGLAQIDPLLAAGYQYYKDDKADKDAKRAAEDLVGKTYQEMVAEATRSEAQAGEDAMYLRKQAMINNVL